MVADEKPWKKYYNPEVNKRVTAKYQKEKMRTIGVKFHLINDADVLAKLDDVPSKMGYIRKLIRDDIKRTGFQVPPSPKELEAQEREAERLAEVEKWHQIQSEADGKPVQSGDSEAEARKLFGM